MENGQVDLKQVEKKRNMLTVITLNIRQVDRQTVRTQRSSELLLLLYTHFNIHTQAGELAGQVKTKSFIRALVERFRLFFL